ncbi:hypothetical protein D5S18_14600 [Nocardia panacis]|uniref:Uncharacterized protein n=1 Tax=Nocardia panacis TaxID=2340916 RepID=A0A3A4K589_9NOCA|nr:hypothetical protein [Nocardia panacis]RJO75643.1 hypothetical protein D5S18_14600 [Nocardia panacis]
MLLSAFHRRLRLATAALLVVGVGLAIFGLVGAADHRDRRAGAFAVAAVVLAVLVPVVLRGGRWVVGGAAIVLGGQWIAVVGTLVELLIGVGASKSADLRRIGVEPAMGVGINLAYSLVAGMLFVWFMIRLRAVWRRRAVSGDSRGADRVRPRCTP